MYDLLDNMTYEDILKYTALKDVVVIENGHITEIKKDASFAEPDIQIEKLTR